MSVTFHGGRKVGAVAVSLALFAVGCGGAATDTAVSAPEAIAEITENEEQATQSFPPLIGDTVLGTQLDTNELDGEDVVVWADLDIFDQPAWAFVNDDGAVDVHVGGLEFEELAERIEALLAS